MNAVSADRVGLVIDRVQIVRDALAGVHDPEFPGISIVSLGMLESVQVDGRRVTVELVPTYAGCPALEYIEADVVAAVSGLASSPGYQVEVVWRRDLAWSSDRINDTARSALGTEFTVSLRDRDGSVRCPVCGSRSIEERSPIGPTPCRSVGWCGDCRNAVEIMRSPGGRC